MFAGRRLTVTDEMQKERGTISALFSMLFTPPTPSAQPLASDEDYYDIDDVITQRSIHCGSQQQYQEGSGVEPSAYSSQDYTNFYSQWSYDYPSGLSNLP